MYEQKAIKTKNPILSKFIEPKWTGTIAYRGLVEVEKLKRMGGEGHRAITDPMMVNYNFALVALPAHMKLGSVLRKR